LHPKPLVVERKVQALIIAPSQPEHAHQCQRIVQLFKVGVAAAGELCEQVEFSGDLAKSRSNSNPSASNFPPTPNLCRSSSPNPLKGRAFALASTGRRKL
jgi:hypothetical protein